MGRIDQHDALVVDLDVGMMVRGLGQGHQRADEEHGLRKVLEGVFLPDVRDPGDTG